MSKSYSTVTQEDKSIALAAQAENVIGAEARQINPIGTSVVLADSAGSTLGDITVNQFPEQVQKTIGQTLGSLNLTTQALGDTLSQQQLGEASQLPRIILYIGLAVVGIMALGVWRR